MSELKACPFCGSEAIIPTNLDGTPTDYEATYCTCSNDDCLIACEWVPIESWNTRPIEDALKARIAELEEFKMIVEGCGFEVITEPPVLNHPERKILKGHGIIYVPELPEPPEVK